MGFLPDIDENGHLKEVKEPKIYTPPKLVYQKSDEKRQEELNHFGHRILSQDFSDSPYFHDE
jgi:hypothetical protein